MPDGIQNLTSAMAAGDAQAIAAFYRDHFDWMFIQAKLATRRDESFCLDVVRDAVVRVMRTVSRVDSEAELQTWLRLVVLTTAFDLLRSEQPPGNASAGERLTWLGEQLSGIDPHLVKIVETRPEPRRTLSHFGRLLGLSTGAIDGRLRGALKHPQTATTTLSALEDPAAMHDDGL